MKSKDERARRDGPSRSAFSPAARYLFFGGKGGTGKTTAACSAALYLLGQARSGERILLFSTDPAHSLSDSLDLDIGDRLAEVARHKKARLFAREMNASAALSDFKERHRSVFALIAERGTLLDESDIDQLLDLSLPGMDEVMALFELSRFESEADFARIIVDTAPSGHTSRLLKLPEVFTRWLGALDRMEDKHRFMVASLARGRVKSNDEVEIFLRDLNERIERVRSMLYDRGRTAFTLVIIPEGMVVEESLRYFDLLRRESLPVTGLIVNRVEREGADCPHCRARSRSQKPWLNRIAREFKGIDIHFVPLLAEEVRGQARLRRFARIAWEGERDREEHGRPAARRARLKMVESDVGFCITPRRLLIFGGKGGVGKTTAAAAAALALADSDSRARVLVFSTDPAHSLSDSFDEVVGELKQGAGNQKNLDGMEIDAVARFERVRKRYREWVDEAFDSLSAGSRWQIQFDREAIRELGSLAPPGIDEIMAMSAISELLERGSYTSIVLDTAPTGHLVRFLEMPEIALSWLRTFMKLLIKYKSVARWGEIAEEMIALSKNIKRMAALLGDPKQCEFVGVAIPERMSLEETARLAERLKRLKTPMRRLLINNVVPV
ncbi:MAG TPA: ArsA family ATPase, partial [Blastocatellia bacterium]|nr:ArsA family ATPase [Blastocatellia bacterium]